MGMRVIGGGAARSPYAFRDPYAFRELDAGSKAVLIGGATAAGGYAAKGVVDALSGDDEKRQTHTYRRRKRK